jgi:hypothetical protein
MKQVLLLVLFFVSRVFVCVFEIVFVIADGITRMVLDWLLGCVFARVSLVSVSLRPILGLVVYIRK